MPTLIFDQLIGYYEIIPVRALANAFAFDTCLGLCVPLYHFHMPLRLP